MNNLSDLNDLKDLNSSSVIKELTEPKKELTIEELRKVRSVYVTRRQDTVEHCGHKFSTDSNPNNNCPYCWFAFFQIFGDVTQTADEVYQKEGKEMLIKIRGKKFTKNFLRFMSTLNYMKENNINGFKDGDTGDSTGEMEMANGGGKGTE